MFANALRLAARGRGSCVRALRRVPNCRGAVQVRWNSAVRWDHGSIPQVVPEVALQTVGAGKGWVLDVREADEWHDLRLAGENTLYVRMGQLLAAETEDDLADLDLPEAMGRSADKPCFVLCKGGVRSQRVASHLQDLGLTHVANVASGVLGAAPSDLDWSTVVNVEPQHLAMLLAATPEGNVLDVREPQETQQASLASPRVVYAPMSRLQTAQSPADLEGVGIPSDLGTAANPAYVMCHAGKRSEAMAAFLRGMGRTHVANVVGGIAHCTPFLQVKVQ